MIFYTYIFGIALFVNGWLKATSSDYKCVSAVSDKEIGIYLNQFKFETQVSSTPNVVEVPDACLVVGVKAKVCSEEENIRVVVPNVTQVLVISEKSVPVNLTAYCVSNTLTSLDQEKSNLVIIRQAPSSKSAQKKEQMPLEGRRHLFECVELRPQSEAIKFDVSP